MDIHAYSRSIKNILEPNRQYIIPRFQREYSWGEEELSTLWNDVITKLKYDEDIKKFVTSDYFVGSLVLAGNDVSDEKFEVVDGQQRLTTITIILSALTEIFKNLGESDQVTSTFKYIEGKDDDNQPFFKILNENPKPFFQVAIQAVDKQFDAIPEGEEEEKLFGAYNYFFKILQEKELSKVIKKNFGDITYAYLDLLKEIRKQLLEFKTIYITVSDKEEAYTIFETLNAKGKDLEPIDLIKNKMFKVLNKEHPADIAKESWKKIKSNLYLRDNKVNISTFYRHFWLSRYSFTTESKLYDEFNKKIESNSISYQNFMNELKKSSVTYIKLTSPLESDWKRQEDKIIYETLLALNIFNTTQVRTLLLALIEQREKNLISQKVFIKSMKYLEKFHFIFTAITSSSPAGLESKFSTVSRKLYQSGTKQDSNKIIIDFINELEKILPKYETFESKFCQLYYTDEVTKNKKLIQYILKKIEESYHKTNEYTVNIKSIEHIKPQSTNAKCIGYIGNLLLLDNTINSDIGNKSFKDKIEALRNSEFKANQEFIEKYCDLEEWDAEDIERRTKELAKLCYNEIW